MPLFYDAFPYEGRRFTSEESARDIVDWVNRVRLPRKARCAVWLDGRLFVPGEDGDDDLFVQPGAWVVSRSGRFSVVEDVVMQNTFLTYERVHHTAPKPSESPDD